MYILYTLTKLEDLNLDNFIIKFCSDVIGFFLLSYYIILYYIWQIIFKTSRVTINKHWLKTVTEYKSRNQKSGVRKKRQTPNLNHTIHEAHELWLKLWFMSSISGRWIVLTHLEKSNSLRLNLGIFWKILQVFELPSQAQPQGIISYSVRFLAIGQTSYMCCDIRISFPLFFFISLFGPVLRFNYNIAPLPLKISIRIPLFFFAFCFPPIFLDFVMPSYNKK